MDSSTGAVEVPQPIASGTGTAPIGSGTRREQWIPKTWENLDRSGLRGVWCVVAGVLAVQLAGLLSWSWSLYERDDLSGDFATFNQAWSQIGQGHLNPTDTVQGIGFWQNHFELILWPIGLLHLISSSPFVLLVLQDLAIVATETVIVLWVAGVCVERLGSVRVWVVGLALAVTVWNPWWYETASFDFHPEMLGLPIVVLSGYSLWRGRTGVALVAGVLALLCGDVATLLVVAVGIAALVSRHARAAGSTRVGLTLVALGAAWFVLITALHANQGSAVTANYDYLAGTAPGASAWSVYLGVAGHPGHVVSVLGSRWHPVEKVLASAGIIGVATPWGFFVSLITLLPAALNVNPAFVSPLTAFQTLPVVPFVLVGTFMLLVTLGVGGTVRTKGSPAAAWAIAGVLVLVALVQSTGLLVQLRSDWWHHDTAQADALREASQKIGPRGEVIASWDAMGGFADRTDIVPLVAVPQTFQLHSPTAWAVIVADHGSGLSAADSAADAAYLITREHTTAVVARDGVWLLRFTPPMGQRSVTLSGAS